ncbi:hypothetical protein [Saccharothrix obliqua]|uniref:hypothetical protein n=1 Tax=Saccharothrix obliqua TaxID=2861747 RepID=UPI001C601233|nr:hypothetical protein [Saccharothrix obliqua]MBW4721386.1 hypothetical protein [Saccharothrix obliqua]
MPRRHGFRERFGLVEYDEDVLRRSLVTRYLRYVAPHVVVTELRTPEAAPRTAHLSEADLVTEVLASPGLADDLRRVAGEHTPDIGSRVRRRNLRRLIVLTAYTVAVLATATAAGLSSPLTSNAWERFGGVVAIFLGIPVLVVSIISSFLDTTAVDNVAFDESAMDDWLRPADEEVLRPATRQVLSRHLDA